MRFHTSVELGGKTATGMQVPDDVVRSLAGGKRPAVCVTVGGNTYRTTVAAMGGRYFVPLSAENRAASGLIAGDEVDVDICLDTEPREVTVPDDLAEVLAEDEGARRFFAGLSYTHRKEWVRWIQEAKRSETRNERIRKTIEALREGKRQR